MNLHPTMLLDAINLLGKGALAIFSPFYFPKLVHLERNNAFKGTSAKQYVQQENKMSTNEQDHSVFLEWVQINITVEQ